MAALIGVQGRFAGFPSGVPDCIPVLDVEITPYTIHRHAVIAVTGYTAELGILIKIIAASGVTDQTEEILVSEVIDPWKWRLGIRDDIFAMNIVEISVLVVLHSIVDQKSMQRYCFLGVSPNTFPTNYVRILQNCQNNGILLFINMFNNI